MRKKMLKQAAAVTMIGLMLSTALLTGCQSKGETAPAGGTETAAKEATEGSQKASEEQKSAEPVKLSFWYEGSGTERTEVFESIIKEWNELHPEILVEGTYVALDTALDKLNVAIAGNAAPDITTLQGSWLGEMFNRDLFLDLTDRFGEWDESSQFTKDFIDVVKMNDKQGRILAVPQAANVFGIWYRSDVYQEKSLTSPADSWDSLFEGIAATTDKTAGVYGHTVRGGATSATQLMYVLISYAGLPDFFDAEGKAQILRSDAAVEIVNRYADVYKNGQAPQSSLTASFKEMAADFTSGTSMSYIHNLGSYETISKIYQPEQYSFVMFPKSPVTKSYVTAVPTVKANAIFKTCEHPDEAWEFLKFWASKNSDSAINKVIGELPVRQDTLKEEWVKGAPQLKEVIPFLEDSNKVSVQTADFLPEYSEIAAQIGEPNFQAVLTGEMTAEDFLLSMAVPLEEAYAEYTKGQ